MKAECISKGKHTLTVVLKKNLDKSIPLFDLDKIPLEVLHKYALQTIGEQESYIEELEIIIDQLKSQLQQKEEQYKLNKEERKKVAEEILKDHEIYVIKIRNDRLRKRNKELQLKYREGVNEICRLIRENEALKKSFDYDNI